MSVGRLPPSMGTVYLEEDRLWLKTPCDWRSRAIYSLGQFPPPVSVSSLWYQFTSLDLLATRLKL